MRIVPQALREAGLTVVIHDEVFRPGTPDHIWLREAGRKGWIVLTKDTRIRYRENEKRALKEAGVAAFVFSGKDLTGSEIGASIVKALPKMQRLIRKTRRPFIAVVTRGGDVRLLN
jgi:PIN like domain